MNRKQFILSQGGTCDNWTYSWSFVNVEKRIIIFGAWDIYTEKKKTLILADEWAINEKGRKSKGFPQALRHISLVEKDGYRLFTFPIKHGYKIEKDGNKTSIIVGFTPELTERKLQKVGNFWYASDNEGGSVIPEELIDGPKYTEGVKSTITVNSYERSRKARSACIAHHGTSCSVCSFMFSDFYGNIGEGFIHVHHIVPIGQIKAEYVIDPIKDLIPVCPNCHAMIHSTEPPLTLAQLKTHLEIQRSLTRR
jgi:5-methylcytosine-specific restriction protein A